MPYYTFHNKDTGEEFDIAMSMAEHETYLENNPNIEQLIVSAPALCDSHKLGRMKPDSGFRDVLKTIKKGSPRSTINTF